MKLTAELSLYPLKDDYVPVINRFLEAAHGRGGITVVTNAMSTQVCGDYEAVFALVSEGLKASFEQFGRQVLVCKFIPGELEIEP